MNATLSKSAATPPPSRTIKRARPDPTASRSGSRRSAIEADGQPVSAGGTNLPSTPLPRAMGVYLSATALSRLINFGRILLLTWFMSRQQFGLLTMVLAVLNVLTPLCSLGLTEAVTRYVPRYEQNGSLRRFLVRSFGLLMSVTLSSVALIWVFSGSLGVVFYAQVFSDPAVLAEFKTDAPALARLSGVVIGLLIAYFYLLAVLKGLRRYGALSAMEVVHSALFFAASIWAVEAGRLSAITLTSLYGLSLLIPVVIFGMGLVRMVRDREGRTLPVAQDAWAARLLRFSVWATLAGITWQAMVYYPAWFLTKVHGHEAVAIFNAVRQIGQFVLIAAVAAVTVVMTTVTKTWETQGREAGRRRLSLAFRGTGLALLVICAILSLSRNAIITLFQPGYAAGAGVLPLHLLFFLLGSYLAFLAIHFHLTEKTRHSFWPWAIGVAANVLFAIWLAGPGFGGIQQSPAWQWAGQWLRPFFVAGFSDPRGLDNSAWCGVFAIATAMVFCVVLIRAECCRLDRGSYVIMAAAGLLALNDYLLVSGMALLLAAALTTSLIFSPLERRSLARHLREALGRAPSPAI